MLNKKHGGDILKNAFKIFKRDLQGMIKNPMAIIIISGLCILPSLYSFLNVIGCWDAYSNTSTLPIAIVNEDTGASIAGSKINIGDSVIANLKTNNSIDWNFVNASEGKIGLASGKYFSELIIPADFSKSLATITTDKPVKPELTYRVNTKMGPVANKITEVAQQTLLAQIKSSIMTSLSQQVFDKLNTYGKKVHENKTEILNLKSAIINLNLNIDNIIKALGNVGTNSNDLTNYLNTLKTTLPAINTGLGEIQTNTQNISGIMSNTKNVLSTSLNNIQLNLEAAKNMMNDIRSASSNLTSSSNPNGTLNQITGQINTVQDILNSNVKFLKGVYKTYNSPQILSLINNINNTNNLVTAQKANVTNSINSGNKVSSSYNSLIQSSTGNVINSINTTLNNYNNGGRAALDNISNGLVSSTNSASSLIGNSMNLNTKIQNVLNSASSGSLSAKEASDSLINYLKQYKGVIGTLSNSLSKISDNNLDQIISLLKGNPVVMGSYAAKPFTFKQEVIYPVANYGSGMTPVYSVLAFWVGMLIAGALLKTEVPKHKKFENMTVREKHFGKMLTFIFIAIVQSLIITIGAKFLVGVQVANLPLFIIGSLVTSITFAIIIFTILSMFGHIGDGIAIVLMVVQLSGTGGTYPVQAMPLFFRSIEPFVPFPYGVDLMREAIGGAYWPNTFKYIAALIVFSIIFVLIGYFLKKDNGRFEKFEEHFKKSGIAE